MLLLTLALTATQIRSRKLWFVLQCSLLSVVVPILAATVTGMVTCVDSSLSRLVLA